MFIFFRAQVISRVNCTHGRWNVIVDTIVTHDTLLKQSKRVFTRLMCGNNGMIFMPGNRQHLSLLIRTCKPLK